LILKVYSPVIISYIYILPSYFYFPFSSQILLSGNHKVFYYKKRIMLTLNHLLWVSQ
jgi:hypothetical protein